MRPSTDHEHGLNWKAGMPLMKQDVSHHLAGVGGSLICGSPVLEEDHGLYLVKTLHRVMAEGIVCDDPAVKANSRRTRTRRIVYPMFAGMDSNHLLGKRTGRSDARLRHPIAIGALTRWASSLAVHGASTLTVKFAPCSEAAPFPRLV